MVPEQELFHQYLLPAAAAVSMLVEILARKTRWLEQGPRPFHLEVQAAEAAFEEVEAARVLQALQYFSLEEVRFLLA